MKSERGDGKRTRIDFDNVVIRLLDEHDKNKLK